ncbi:MAG: outer membrane beta-barrel protein [Pirellulales bacterium]|nr:outer membrane beta-barrel protein [Pirellulales bacterium]
MSGLREGSPGAGGFAGNFWAMTWGLNYLIGNNTIIRPELRYDWFSADEGGPNGPVGTMPYGRLNEQNAQFYGGCDIIWQF